MESIRIFVGDEVDEFRVGKEGVKKIFLDNNDQDTIVILQEENILKYHGFSFIAIQQYKEKSED